MKLVKYRDAGMNTHTYFWKNDNNSTISPYFDTDKEALSWATEKGYEVGTLEEQSEFETKRNYPWNGVSPSVNAQWKVEIKDPWDEWKATKDIT